MDYVYDPETDAFGLTKTGVQKYQSRFARAGIDVEQIKTAKQFNSAMDKSFLEVEMPDHAEAIRQKLPVSIDRDLLIAVIEGDDQEAARLQALIKRRNEQFRL